MSKTLASLFASALVTLPFVTAAPSTAPQCQLPGERRQECGYLGITQGECEAKSCCWSPISGPVNYPWCFYPNDVDCGEYVAQDIQQTPTGISAILKLKGSGCNYYGADIETLKMTADFETDTRLHVKIFDPNVKRWEVPETLIPRPKVSGSYEKSAQYRFGFDSSPFGFYVSRVDNGQVIFNSSASLNNPQFKNLVFENQYLEVSTQLPSGANIYGIGEHVHPLRWQEGVTKTLWSADEPNPVNQNLYGGHPFYMELRNGKAHGVFLLNSNGMDVELNPGHLTYKIIGGVLDFYFFLGPTPADVISQYTEVIGRPYMLPYWSLGFHQCKYGYKNLQEVKDVVQGYADAQIPLEAMWIDIDHMDGFRVWTFDPVNYPAAEVKQFFNDLHSKNQRSVLIVDPGIKNDTNYKYYQLGIEQDIFIKDAKTGKPALGMVWPYYTHFPDFLNPKTGPYWTESIRDFMNLAPVDGLWIDMNEVASFCYGTELSTCKYPEVFDPKGIEEKEQEKEEKEELVSAFGGEYRKRSLIFDPNDPPYKINNANIRDSLNRKTTQMDSYHYGGVIEYDAHNLYGLSEIIATRNSLEQVTGKRAFVLSRSTFPGSGKHGGHWTGDNYSTWEYLYYSIAGMLNFQLFGIPYVGADICGFIRDTTEELCARWQLVGSFYPFARNHNTLGAKPQEPYLWESVANASRYALGIRYSILPLYYTLLYQANSQGATITRPLFFEYPTDPNTFDNDYQFLIGNTILISPVLTQGATSVDAYFPRGRWYDFNTYQVINSVGQFLKLDVPLEYIPVHIRGGSVLIKQYPKLTTTDTRKSNFNIVVALDDNSSAKGQLYLDDGESLDQSKFTYVEYVASGNSTSGSLTASGTFYYNTSPVTDNVTILGVTQRPSYVVLNGRSINFTYSSNVLTLPALSISMNSGFTLTWA